MTQAISGTPTSSLHMPIRLRPSYRAFIFRIIIAYGLLAWAFYVSILVPDSPQEGPIFIGVMLVLISIFIAVKPVLYRLANLYILEDDRAIQHRGIIARKIVSIRYGDVRSVAIEQGVMDRIFNYGTLVFNTAASDEQDVVFKNIKNPKRYAEIAENIIKKQQTDD